MQQFYVYLHCKPNRSPFYIGKGTGRRYKYLSGRNRHHKSVVKKYGKENVLFSKIECSTEKFAFDLECGLIKCFRRMGYVLTNMTSGGEGAAGIKRPDAVREKISKSMRGKRNSLGRTLTEEHKLKIAKAGFGRKNGPISAETRKKISDAAKRQARNILSEESKQKISTAAKMQWATRREEMKMSMRGAKRKKKCP